ncbi:MAG TPA: hypothetical protein VE954_40225 [Oligoflexus sp.]|nr:hypothetical protein [Oligoflexus sp.]HYX39369.1 hypothetical protein [Oligoflexus sp.]
MQHILLQVAFSCEADAFQHFLGRDIARRGGGDDTVETQQVESKRDEDTSGFTCVTLILTSIRWYLAYNSRK